MSPLSSIPSISPALLQQMDRLQGGGDELGMPSMPSAVPSALPATAPADSGSFSNLLGKMVSEVNDKQMAAGESVSALQGGANVPLHQAVISMEEASVSFQLMVEVRNRLLESYQEIMRMQV